MEGVSGKLQDQVRQEDGSGLKRMVRQMLRHNAFLFWARFQTVIVLRHVIN